MNWPRRITILTHEFFPRIGGIATYVEEIARAASAQGFEVSVWAPGDHRWSERDWPFQLRPLDLKGTQDWSCRWRLRQALKSDPSWQDEILYLPEPGPIRTWLYRDWLDLPHPARLVLTFHGSEINRLQRLPYRMLLLRRLLNRAHRVGVVSQFVKQSLRTTRVSEKTEIVTVPGAPRSIFLDCPAPTAKQSKEGFNVLNVGRLHPRKGQLDLVTALSHLPESLKKQTRLTLAGPVVDRTYWEKVCRAANESQLQWEHEDALTDHDLRKRYRAADLFVLPSRPESASVEGLGLVLLEAAACGLPVIATRTGGTSEAMVEGQNGLLVAPSDAAQLATRIGELLADPERRNAMGRFGYSWVRDSFSWQDNVSRLFGKG